MKAVILFFVITLLTFSHFAYSQTDSTLVRIETTDGNEYLGTVVSQNETTLQLKTRNLGIITLNKTDIISQERANKLQIKKGQYWFPNPQSTRYFWAPNAYGLKKGEGYYQNIYVLWNQFVYGLTDNFSFGAGVVPLFLFGGAPTPIFTSIKFSLPIDNEKFNFGAGAIAGTILGESTDAGAFGIMYAVSTFGSPDKNLTLGLGYGFAAGEIANSPIINLSGLYRISNRGYLITENYLISSGDGGVAVIGLGGRWIIKKASLDFMLAIPAAADMGAFIAVPVIGFSIPLGKNK